MAATVIGALAAGDFVTRPTSAVSPVAPLAAPGPPQRSTPAAQALGLRPDRVVSGTGPYGSVAGTGTGAVALTFDDGPDPVWTPLMLAVLRTAGVKATFCLVGRNVAAFPELVRAIAADGHTLCNHTWAHNMFLGALSRTAIADDLARTNAAIKAAVPGARIAYFRMPAGRWTPGVVTVARELGMAALHWAVDLKDWTRPPVPVLAVGIIRACRAGNVVLLHDAGGDRRNTVDALGQALPALVQTHVFVPLPTGSP
jgi:peptidoglycan/xylan/chitin deacetylase (PgdA/CDA1 family)